MRDIDLRRLARFRADPEKVRVSVRRHEDGWLAKVSQRSGAPEAWAFDGDPVKAVNMALERGIVVGIDGIDLDMQWAYDHPHRPDAHTALKDSLRRATDSVLRSANVSLGTDRER